MKPTAVDKVHQYPTQRWTINAGGVVLRAEVRISGYQIFANSDAQASSLLGRRRNSNSCTCRWLISGSSISPGTQSSCRALWPTSGHHG